MALLLPLSVTRNKGESTLPSWARRWSWRPIMKKLSMLGLIGGAALVTAVPFSLQWSQKNVPLSLDSAEAAGVSRRVHLRVYRRAVYGTPVARVRTH
jgi:hypothetical protein